MAQQLEFIGIDDGVVYCAVLDSPDQGFSTRGAILCPAEFRERCHCLIERLDVARSGPDFERFTDNVGKGCRSSCSHAIDELRLHVLVGGSESDDFLSWLVNRQSCGGDMRALARECGKNLPQLFGRAQLQSHAKMIGKCLREFVLDSVAFIRAVIECCRRVLRDYAQLPESLDLIEKGRVWRAGAKQSGQDNGRE